MGRKKDLYLRYAETARLPARVRERTALQHFAGDSVTERIEGAVSYQCLALTDGYHYRLTFDQSIGISEVQVRLVAYKAEMATANDIAVYYISPSGL